MAIAGVQRDGHCREVNIRGNDMDSVPGLKVAILDRWPLYRGEH